MAVGEQEWLRRFEALLHATRDFVAIASIDGHVEFINRGGRELIGIPDDLDIGSTVILDYLTEEGVKSSLEVEQPAVVRDGRWQGISTLKDWRTGQGIPVEISSFLLRDVRSGKPLALGTVQRDIRERREHEERLAATVELIRSSENRHRSLLEHMSDLVLAIDRQETLTYSSPSTTRLFGYRAGDSPTLNLFDRVEPASRERVAAAWARILETPGLSDPVRFRVSTLLGTSLDVEAVANNLFDDPVLNAVVVVMRDVTERARAEEALASQAHVLEMIARAESLEDVLDAVARLVEEQVNSSLCSILLTGHGPLGPVLRHAAGPSLPKDYHDAIDGEPVGNTGSPCSEAAYSGKPVLVADLFGDERWAGTRSLARQVGVSACWSFPIVSPATSELLGTFALYKRAAGMPLASDLATVDRASHLVGVAIDRHRSEQRLAHLATHDELTGLPNRTLLLDRLEHAIGRAQRHPDSVPVVMFIDLDRFKVLNDSLGHDRGDRLLVAVAERLVASVRPTDTVARFGGDEFVVVAEEASIDVAPTLTRKLLQRIAEPVMIDGHEARPTASAGVVFASNYHSPSAVIRDADIAMYRAKNRGGADYELFDRTMGRHATERLRLEEDMRRGIQAGEFRVHYQPVMALDDERVVGFEALVRWQHPERGLLGPHHFIALAEETGLMVPLGSWVLKEASRTVASWRQGPFRSNITLSVNLSGRQLGARGLPAEIQGAVAVLAPWQLCMELTESTLMKDGEAAHDIAGLVTGAGAMLSIDDFGTGYSSLSYLTRLPVSVLKIDQSFVADLGQRPQAAAVAETITDLAGRLGMRVIAEGVETREQADILRSLGCRFAQGYLFHRPLEADDAGALLGVVGNHR